jgi:AraC-like DNA-binding protein
MVNFGPAPRVVRYGDREANDRFDHAWLAGMQDQRLVHASEGGSDHIAVRFRPGGAHAFFDLPMDSVTNQVVPLGDLLGRVAADLRDRLGATEGDEARCRVFEAWLLERRASVHPYFATVRRAVDLLRGHAHGVRVSDLCDRLGLSNRHLINQFRRTVGLAPKTYARIERLQGVIQACRGRTAVAWSRVAAQAGYADQSHLIREFRRLAGVTPAEFLTRRTPDESHVIVA